MQDPAEAAPPLDPEAQSNFRKKSSELLSNFHKILSAKTTQLRRLSVHLAEQKQASTIHSENIEDALRELYPDDVIQENSEGGENASCNSDNNPIFFATRRIFAKPVLTNEENESAMSQEKNTTAGD